MLLDIGVGGGDIDVWMVQESRRRKIRIEITAVDYDERVMTTAREIVAGVSGDHVAIG